MRARFCNCEILDLSDSRVDVYQAALIQSELATTSKIVDVGDYRVSTRLDEIAQNYQYDEDADDIMNNELEYI